MRLPPAVTKSYTWALFVASGRVQSQGARLEDGPWEQVDGSGLHGQWRDRQGCDEMRLREQGRWRFSRSVLGKGERQTSGRNQVSERESQHRRILAPRERGSNAIVSRNAGPLSRGHRARCRGFAREWRRFRRIDARKRRRQSLPTRLWLGTGPSCCRGPRVGRG